MKISYNEATAMGCSSLEKDLVLCESIGYDFIEIRLDMLREYLKTNTVNDLKTFFDKSRIKPHAFNALFDINFTSEEEWKVIIDDFMLACDTGKIIGSHYVVVVPTVIKTANNYKDEEIIEDSIKGLIKLSDIGREYSMNLAFEPVGNCYVGTVKMAWDIVKKINREDVGIAFDAFNLYMYEKKNNFEDMKMIDVEKLFVVHLDDGEDRPVKELDHCYRCFPGEGVIDLKNYVKTLKEMNYTGMISIETFRPEYWRKDPEWVIRQGYETTKKLLESV
jgi:2-keto-myo-inositol isomerase